MNCCFKGIRKLGSFRNIFIKFTVCELYCQFTLFFYVCNFFFVFYFFLFDQQLFISNLFFHRYRHCFLFKFHSLLVHSSSWSIFISFFSFQSLFFHFQFQLSFFSVPLWISLGFQLLLLFYVYVMSQIIRSIFSFELSLFILNQLCCIFVS